MKDKILFKIKIITEIKIIQKLKKQLILTKINLND